MPYGVSDSQPDCDGFAAVKQNDDGALETIGCHDTKQAAIDQMVAVSLAEEIEPLGDLSVRVDGGEVVVIDLDLTLVMNSRDPIESVVAATNALDTFVFICTGREEAQRETTLADLQAAGVQYDTLYMMPEIDMDIPTFKRDTIATLMQEGYEILAFVDDNADNRKTVESLGVRVLTPEQFVLEAVAEGVLDTPGEDDDTIELSDYEQRAVDLVAPSFMARSAERGMRLHEEGLSGDGLVPATVRDARRMIDGEPLSESKWRRMPGWFARHIQNLDAVEGDEITPGLVAILLWGGGSSKTSARRAQAYAERIVARLDNGERGDDDARYNGSNMSETIEQVRWISDTISETRSVAYTTLEMRADGDSNTLIGYAALFDSPSEPMPFTEFVRRGAFAKTLSDGADVRLLIDHEGVPLARTRSNTLMLEEDERGLRVEAALDPANPDAQRVLSAIRRGDLSQMSFAFRTVKDSFNADRTVRELKEVQLFDVSVVTYPAYEDTIVSLRGRQSVTVDVSGSLSLRKRQIQIARQR